MSWTPQQETAINARGSSIIVSAAAGSGKTAVLTERLAKLIADKTSGVRADRIIVVTFTNDAATELKKRLESKLRSMISDDPSNAHLLRQQTLLQSAKISTINSFCFDLIRDNISDQGITSGFGVLDDADNKVLRAQAMDELFDYYAQNEYEKISFLYDRFCVKGDRALRAVIETADDFLSSVALREKWLDKAVEEYRKPFRESIYFEKLQSSLMEKAEAGVRAASDCLNMIPGVFPDTSVSQAVKSLKKAEDDYEKLCRLRDIVAAGRKPSPEEEKELVSFASLERLTAKVGHNSAVWEAYKARRNLLKKIPSEIVDALSTVESDFKEGREATEVLVEVLRKYQEIIWRRKCEKNAISFDDGERLALELLADEDENGRLIQSETAKRAAESFDIVMIDEYQDSNNKQDVIFKLLSKNYRYDEKYGPMYGDNVFLVGDVKQSIYRFRLANPKNFINTLKASEPYSEESSFPNKSIVLNRNFRSSEGVIDFVNFVFSRLMSEKCGDIVYDEDEALYFGAKEYEGFEGGKTELCFIYDDPDEDDEKPASAEERSPEAAYTASRIAEMLANGEEVVERGGKRRPCRPSDFSVLVRGNKYVNIYAKELERLGVPAKGNEESGYLRSREIAVLTDLLRIVNNPLLDVPMAAVMTSPMYMFGVGELALIKSLDRNRPIYSILLRIASRDYPELTDEGLIARCSEFLKSLAGFRLDAATMTLGELIARIYDATDFVSVMQLYSDGDKKRANLRALVRYAENYESSVAYEGSGGLGGFVRHIDRVLENGDYAQGKISASSGDRVSIQTMHSSKGLEFPFVFIAETSKKFRFDSDAAICSSDGRIGYSFYDPKLVRRYRTFQHTTLTSEENRDSRSEEMRLLYVALTRAKQKLFINLKCGAKALKRAKSLLDGLVIRGCEVSEAAAEALSFSDWLWSAIFKSEKFPEIAEKLGLEAEYGFPSASAGGEVFSYDISRPELAGEIFSGETKEAPEPDEAIYRELKDIIGYRYDTSLSETPAKLSVTQITRKLKGDEEEFDFKLKRPAFKSLEKKLTGAERGTAIHTFFQYCDFDAAKSSPEAEIKRMTENGYLTAEQADSIDCGNVSAFFGSELYERLRSADRVWREKKFMVAVRELGLEGELMEVLSRSDGMIKGVVDLAFEEDGEIILVDYKSDRGVSAEKLAERYAAQLGLYRSAIELMTKKRVREAYLYSFELKKQIPVSL